MSGWYYAEGSDTRGPLSVDELISVLRRQRDGQNVLVWRQGFEDWIEAGAVPELSQLIVGLPPVLQRAAPAPTRVISSLAHEYEQVPVEGQPRNWIHKIVGWIVVWMAAICSGMLGQFFGMGFWIPLYLIGLSWWLFAEMKLRNYIVAMLGVLVGHTLWTSMGHAFLLSANKPDPDIVLFSFEFVIVLVLVIWAIRTQSVAVSVCIFIYQLFVLGTNVILGNVMFIKELDKVISIGTFMHISLRAIGVAAAFYAVIRSRQLKREGDIEPLAIDHTI